MGTLRNVYQLKPQAIYGGAFLQVKTGKAADFMKEFEADIKKRFADSWNPSNMELQVSEDGKVLIHGMNQEDRTVDLKNPGMYVLVQSGNKRGFDSEFTDCLDLFSDRLEDVLFYVTWDDDVMRRFEIRDGVLIHQQLLDMEKWNYRFEKYLEEQYASDPQLLTDFFVDYLMDLKAGAEAMTQYGSDLDEYFEREEYEEFLEKLESYTAENQYEAGPEMSTWLKDKIAGYRSLEERQKDARAGTKE